MDYLLKIKYLETLLVKTKESFLSKNRKVLKPKLYIITAKTLAKQDNIGVFIKYSCLKFFWACSSAVECVPCTDEVSGSNPDGSIKHLALQL